MYNIFSHAFIHGSFKFPQIASWFIYVGIFQWAQNKNTCLQLYWHSNIFLCWLQSKLELDEDNQHDFIVMEKNKMLHRIVIEYKQISGSEVMWKVGPP